MSQQYAELLKYAFGRSSEDGFIQEFEVGTISWNHGNLMRWEFKQLMTKCIV